MKASGSFQLDAAYTNQRPGSRRKVGGVAARSLASASLYGLHVRKIITASFCLTEKEFLSVPPESSGLFEPHFLLVEFDTETLFFPPTTQTWKLVLLGRSRGLFKDSGKTRLAFAMNIVSTLTIILINILRAACRFSASERSTCFSCCPQVCLCEGLSTHMLPFMILL